MVRIETTHLNLPEAAKSGDPVELIDPTTGRTFVILSLEQYRNMCGAFSGDGDPREAYPLIDRILHDDDAEDPLLESYQE